MSEYKPTNQELRDKFLAKMNDPERLLHPKQDIVTKTFCYECIHNCKRKRCKQVGYGVGCQEFKKK